MMTIIMTYTIGSEHTQLIINNCEQLFVFPVVPSSIVEVSITNCFDLELFRYPLNNVTHFSIKFCGSIKELPEMESLMYLDIRSCKKLYKLPDYMPDLISQSLIVH